ncbi:WD40 repeat-like protein [Dacryopinax primogenitus]|uniref:WD40 repeat-like protein n=1 Tax=Dacryopinax primogenitus (strain DJM 731) TaxID=1858805 RepID=M5G8Y9_DACPD|nr:WD40 repeat-like protein [Dacryopinax primogenitus]EJU04650.1 WD40 repeat-like protein [Dacryopinax primogenitus]
MAWDYTTDQPLLQDHPTTVTSTTITSHHRELRDLLVCPHTRGQVFYIRNTSLFYQDILASHAEGAVPAAAHSEGERDAEGEGEEGEEDPPGSPEQVCDVRFHPVCLSYGAGLLAAGGLHSELALRPLHGSRWTYTTSLSKSINNSLLVTSLSLPCDESGSTRTRLFVSNNDRTVTAYEVGIDEDLGLEAPQEGGEGADGEGEGEGGCRMELSGSVRLNTALNHGALAPYTLLLAFGAQCYVDTASLSPDGRTLLAVGDTPDVFVLNVTGGRGTEMQLTTVLEAADASFSTSWSPDGRKFAVSSQNGEVRVWDVRSTKPLAKFFALKPGASTRAVKFSPPGARELLAFAEGSSNLHIVDARTFAGHKTYTVPPTTPVRQGTRTKRFQGTPRSLSPVPSSTSSTSAAAAAAYMHLPPPIPIHRSLPLALTLSLPLLQSLQDYKPPLPWYASGYGSNTDPEITGLVWDPTGRWVYVGTEGSVAEWEAGGGRGWCDAVEFA